MSNEYSNTKSELIPELDLLINLCKIKLGKNPDIIDFQKIDSINWGLFFKLCGSHRLYPLVNNILNKFPNAIPPEIKENFSERSLQNQMLIMKLAGELNTLHSAFTNEKIDFVALKGPLMVFQLYGDYSLRQTRDLDILVSKKDIDNAISTLFKHGYNLIDKYFFKNSEKRSLYLIRENHVRLYNPTKKILVELHWAASKQFTRIKTENLFSNTINFEASGKTFKTLNLNNYLVYLAAHGVSHQYVRLFWLYDIAQILTFHKVNYDELIACSIKYGCTSAVKVSIVLASRVFNLDVQQDFQCNKRLNTRERFLAETCYQSIIHAEQEQTQASESKPLTVLRQRYYHMKYQFLMTDDFNSKWQIIKNIFIKPYVWAENEKLPKSNFVYLAATQIKWMRMVLSGKMKENGKVIDRPLK